MQYNRIESENKSNSNNKTRFVQCFSNWLNPTNKDAAAELDLDSDSEWVSAIGGHQTFEGESRTPLYGCTVKSEAKSELDGGEFGNFLF